MATRWTMDDVRKTVAGQSHTARLRNMAGLDQVAPQPKRPKYGNRKVTDSEGRVHDSTKEFRRWQELGLSERSGDIRHLRRQVPFALVVGGVLVCTYIADFVYEDGAAEICEDVKSPATRKLAVYAIKKKLMKAIYKIDIREV